MKTNKLDIPLEDEHMGVPFEDEHMDIEEQMHFPLENDIVAMTSQEHQSVQQTPPPLTTPQRTTDLPENVTNTPLSSQRETLKTFFLEHLTSRNSKLAPPAKRKCVLCSL